MTATIPELHVGDRLRITRDKAKISRESMAKEFAVSVGAISQWENGRTQPRHLLDVMRKWAELTGYSLDWIAFGDSGDATTRQNADWGFHFLDSPLPFDLAEAS